MPTPNFTYTAIYDVLNLIHDLRIEKRESNL